MKTPLQHLWSLLYIGFYGCISVLTLTKFPFAHSDEPWLAGLSYEYLIHGTPFVTEPFFDLMPRQAHMIKSLFHGLQALFIQVFGYSLFSVRLLSLLAALMCLFFFDKLLQKIADQRTFRLLGLILFSLNLQFIYASHFGRQEILLCAVLLMAANQLLRNGPLHTRQIIFLGVIIGLSIGLHPNAFIIAVIIGCGLGFEWLQKRLSFAALALYGGLLSFFGALYVGLSLLGNPRFFSDYWAFGKTLAVDAVPIDRLENFIHFYQKIYHQVSGTYYLNDLKVFMLLSACVLILSLWLFFSQMKNHQQKIHRHLGLLISLFIGFNLALFVIGRYNPTSIIFGVIILFLLFYQTLQSVSASPKLISSILIFLILLSGIQTTSELMRHQNDHYDAYLETIKSHLPQNAIVLGNLNSGFAFQDIPFYDIRNLDYLNGMKIADYIQSRNINTLIYYESYDYIHRNPEWQILYGDDSAYYDDLQDIIKKNGTILYHFEDSQYGNRIVDYMYDYPWQVTIYQLKN